MRKINVLEFVSLDGVVQASGGPEEDTSGGSDEVRRLEYHDFSRMAAVRVSKRGYCGKNQQN